MHKCFDNSTFMMFANANEITQNDVHTIEHNVMIDTSSYIYPTGVKINYPLLWNIDISA